MRVLKKPLQSLLVAICLIMSFPFLILEARANGLEDIPAATEESVYEPDDAPETEEEAVPEIEYIPAPPQDYIHLPPVEVYTPPAPVVVEDVISVNGDPFANEILRLINIERFHEGVAPVAQHPALTRAARIRAQENLPLNQEQFLSHMRPSGQPWHTVLAEVNIPRESFRDAGENIARGFCTPCQVVNAWMASPLHRSNLLSPQWVTTGLGVSRDQWGRIDVVQLFCTDDLSFAL